MGIKKYKPITPTMRYKTGYSYEEITKKEPEKSLLRKAHKKSGRNNTGRITCRHRGGGHRRHYRVIDFKRNKLDVPAKVAGIEYDPNRTANIALLHYLDGEKRYILAPLGLKVGDKVLAGDKAEMRIGNAMALDRIPLGTFVHNIELKPGRGGQIARSAGAHGQIVAKEGNYVHVKMPSDDVYILRRECFATIGQVGNLEHSTLSLGKAGRSRWMGKRPTVRGVAMNPVDHPMGGGEGKSSGGGHPVSPWGVFSKGGKTRKSKKYSDKYIIRSKKKK